MTSRARQLKYTLAGVGLLPIVLALLAAVFFVGWLFGGWFVDVVDAISSATGVPLTLLLIAIAFALWRWGR